MSSTPPSFGTAANQPAMRLIGGPAPWADLPGEQRRPIPMATVLDALARSGQTGDGPPAGVERPADPLAEWRALLPDGAPPGEGGASAVLVGLFEEAGEARVLLTRRSAELRTHRGQVSFPGGRMNPGERAPDAALREAREEIDLDPSAVTVVGWLHPLFTLNAALVLPIVGVIKRRPRVVANPDEVARVFDVELAELVSDGVYQEGTWDPYEQWSTSGPQVRSLWFFNVAGERVWGATARMLHELALLALGLDPA